MADFPLINGYYPSWASVEVRLSSGRPFLDITAISYSDSIEEELVRGAGRNVRGRTRGRYNPEEGTLTLLEPAFRAFVAAFPPGWGDVITVINVQWREGGQTHNDVLEGVRFLGANGGGEEGPEALKREVKFSFLRLKRDGKYLVVPS